MSSAKEPECIVILSSDESEDGECGSPPEVMFLERKDHMLDRSSPKEEDTASHSDQEQGGPAKRKRSSKISGDSNADVPEEGKRRVKKRPSQTVKKSPKTPSKAKRPSSGDSPAPSKAKRSILDTLSPSTVPSDTTQWHTHEEKDIKPPPLSFRPARQPGPQNKTRRTQSPLDFFRLFFTDAVIKTLLKNTNAYGSQKTPLRGKWKDFTFEDMFSFLSITIFMGLMKLPQMVDYWRSSPPYNIPFPPSVISRSKFANMCRCFHICSLEKDAENQAAKGTSKYDRLGKIKPLYSQIVEACKVHFHPNQNLSIDERMVKSKARISLKQYIKNKPTRWGYKLFVLADSATGYTWNFFVFEGNTASLQSRTGKGVAYDTVMSLMDVEQLGTGYHLYVDNFYTSPLLFRDLLAKNIGACGTLSKNRMAFLRTKLNDFAPNAPRGSLRWLRDGELLFVKWKDSREVVLCSTIHKAYDGETVHRRFKKGDKWELVPVPIPSAIRAYNKHMGGVDLSDALIGYYNVLHKTKKWYRTFFYHFVDVAVVNAHILYNHCHKDKRMTQREFREALVQQLAKNGSGTTSLMVTTQNTLPTAENTHKPLFVCEQMAGKEASKEIRRCCSLCNRKTPVLCETCEVALCFLPQRNCYRMWHTELGL